MADKQIEKADDSNDKEEVKVVRNNPPWPLITIGIVGTVVVLACIIGGWAFISSRSQDQSPDRFNQLSQRSQLDKGQRMSGNSGGGMRGRTGMMDANAIRGVVTAVNVDTLTVSGSGKQVTVKKTATTTIGGDKTSLAVNDTVVIVGDTASDGTVTATRILIRNQATFEGASCDDSQEGSLSTPSI